VHFEWENRRRLDAHCYLSAFFVLSSERKTYTNIIYNNVLTAMKTLCLHSSRFGEVSPDLAEGKALIESDLKEDQPVDEVLGAHIKSLWLDPAIQETVSGTPHPECMRGSEHRSGTDLPSPCLFE
jgi:hypothetical protein